MLRLYLCCKSLSSTFANEKKHTLEHALPIVLLLILAILGNLVLSIIITVSHLTTGEPIPSVA
jgi:hypothetical protein